MAQARKLVHDAQIIAMLADGAVTKNAAVIMGQYDNSVKMPTAADPTGGVIGVAMAAAADGDTVDVAVNGAIHPVVASAAIARGANLAIAGTTGKVKTAAPGAGVNNCIVGIALEDAAADTEIFAALVRVGTLQG